MWFLIVTDFLVCLCNGKKDATAVYTYISLQSKLLHQSVRLCSLS